MPTLESLTVEQLAALCGLTRADSGAWRAPSGGGPWRRYVVPRRSAGPWNVWPDGITGQCIEAPNEHAALVALARHLNLTPKEDAVKYKRIDRDPKTDDYVGYTPRAGDRWHFGRGPVWTVSDRNYVGVDGRPFAHSDSVEIRALTTHIERPVKVRDVKGPDYKPQVGDVLCGPDGAVFTLSRVSYGWRLSGDKATIGLMSAESIAAVVALCTRIERED